jgi:hypothetical protein
MEDEIRGHLHKAAWDLFCSKSVQYASLRFGSPAPKHVFKRKGSKDPFWIVFDRLLQATAASSPSKEPRVSPSGESASSTADGTVEADFALKVCESERANGHQSTMMQICRNNLPSDIAKLLKNTDEPPSTPGKAVPVATSSSPEPSASLLSDTHGVIPSTTSPTQAIGDEGDYKSYFLAEITTSRMTRMPKKLRQLERNVLFYTLRKIRSEVDDSTFNALTLQQVLERVDTCIAAVCLSMHADSSAELCGGIVTGLLSTTPSFGNTAAAAVDGAAISTPDAPASPTRFPLLTRLLMQGKFYGYANNAQQLKEVISASANNVAAKWFTKSLASWDTSRGTEKKEAAALRDDLVFQLAQATAANKVYASQVAEKDARIAEKDARIAEKDARIEQQAADMRMAAALREASLVRLAEANAANQIYASQVAEKDARIAEKDARIEQQAADMRMAAALREASLVRLAEANAANQIYASQVAEKDARIEQQATDLKIAATKWEDLVVRFARADAANQIYASQAATQSLIERRQEQIKPMLAHLPLSTGEPTVAAAQLRPVPLVAMHELTEPGLADRRPPTGAAALPDMLASPTAAGTAGEIPVYIVSRCISTVVCTYTLHPRAGAGHPSSGIHMPASAAKGYNDFVNLEVTVVCWYIWMVCSTQTGAPTIYSIAERFQRSYVRLTPIVEGAVNAGNPISKRRYVEEDWY